MRLGLERIGRAPDQSARLSLAEMQHDVGRHLIGSVLLASQYRQLQHIENGVAELVQAGIKEGAHQSVDRANTGRCHLRRRGLPKFVDVLVADHYDVVLV